MKIRFLLHNVYGAGGGVLTVTFNLAQDLAARHDVEIVSVLRTADEARVPLPQGVAVRALADLRPGVQPGGLRGMLRRWALDRPSRLVPESDPRHANHSLYSDWRLLTFLWSVRSGALVGMQPGMNVVVARFGPRRALRVVQEHRPFRERVEDLRAAYRRYAPRLDAFLTLTEADARRARRELGDGVYVTVIPNGSTEYDGEPPDQSSRVVLAAGRLERSKGFDLLLAAWARIADDHPGWTLRIFGDGSMRQELEQQILDLGIGDSAALMGYSTQLQQEMARSSLFVLSSRREGYGMVLVEAMSCGLPVVSFDCPTGPREIIQASPGGVLVEKGDVGAMAEALSGMMDLSPEKRRELGAAARAQAHLRSRPLIAEQWERLLAERKAARRRRTRRALNLVRRRARAVRRRP